MKKLFLSFLLVSFSAGAVWIGPKPYEFSSYQELRDAFQSKLFNRQGTLMKKKQYYKFIEPYLKEAEENLKMLKYVKDHFNSRLSREYIDRLLDYNVGVFRLHVKKNIDNIKAFSTAWAKLKNLILENKDELQMNLNEAQKELDDTYALIEKVNLAFYKKLGPWQKFILLLS